MNQPEQSFRTILITRDQMVKEIIQISTDQDLNEYLVLDSSVDVERIADVWANLDCKSVFYSPSDVIIFWDE